MGTIAIANIILEGNQNDTLDLTGVSTNVLLEKAAGNLDLIVTENVSLRGVVEGALTLSGNGNITLTGAVVCQQFNRDNFTGTINLNGYWFDYSTTIFWIYATDSNVFETWRITGGIA